MMPGSPDVALAKINHLFGRHARGYHFYIRDLRTGQQTEIGKRRSYPIGSCFKLAVLAAVFERLSPEDMELPVHISPERFRGGGGVVNFLDSSLALTPFQMLQLMLAASDGTATDMLIERVGLPAVNEVLQRFAPDSYLNYDLGDMVSVFRALPKAATCKHYIWPTDELSNFVREVNRLGATNGRDLAELAMGVWNSPPPANLADFWERCLDRKRTIPRTEMFFSGAVGCFSKTGSLGQRFFTSDCGALFDPRSREAIACFGYCSYGWQLPSWTVDVACGLIGLEILKYLSLDATPNSDWTDAGAGLLS